MPVTWCSRLCMGWRNRYCERENMSRANGLREAKRVPVVAYVAMLQRETGQAQGLEAS